MLKLCLFLFIFVILTCFTITQCPHLNMTPWWPTRSSNPSKHESLTHCWFNVGPPTTTLAQHWTNNGWKYRAGLETQEDTWNSEGRPRNISRWCLIWERLIFSMWFTNVIGLLVFLQTRYIDPMLVHRRRRWLNIGSMYRVAGIHSNVALCQGESRCVDGLPGNWIALGDRGFTLAKLDRYISLTTESLCGLMRH